MAGNAFNQSTENVKEIRIMRGRWVEIQCDNCGTSDYMRPGSELDTRMRYHGWIVTADRKDICSPKCLKKYREKELDHER